MEATSSRLEKRKSFLCVFVLGGRHQAIRRHGKPVNCLESGFIIKHKTFFIPNPFKSLNWPSSRCLSEPRSKRSRTT